jgi:glycosyltransferase involved in cell wall biosynthesis
VNAPATRTFEHCRQWVREGHEVHVVTCIPSHPAGVPFPGYRSRWYHREIHDGIVVHRVWTWLAANRGVLKRTVNFLSFVPTAVLRALRLGRFDVVVGTSPQFFCAVAAWMTAAASRTPWIFELRDLWPESIHAVGAKRRYMPMRLLERLELRLYRSAHVVVALSQAFIEDLVRRGIDRSKLAFVPNGIDVAFWAAGSRPRGRAILGAGDEDVLVSYVGTIGMAHDVGTIVDAAARLGVPAAGRKIRFAIVGDGAELPVLRARAAGLDHVRFTGLMPREQMPDLLAASDVMLVTLKRADTFKTVLPSKMFEAMAAARPILLAVEGEAQTVLERSGGGVAVPPGDAAALAAAIEHLASDRESRERLGDAGRRFVDSAFNRRVWASRFLQILGRTRVSGTIDAVAEPRPHLSDASWN